MILSTNINYLNEKAIQLVSEKGIGEDFHKNREITMEHERFLYHFYGMAFDMKEFKGVFNRVLDEMDGCSYDNILSPEYYYHMTEFIKHVIVLDDGYLRIKRNYVVNETGDIIRQNINNVSNLHPSLIRHVKNPMGICATHRGYKQQPYREKCSHRIRGERCNKALIPTKYTYYNNANFEYYTNDEIIHATDFLQYPPAYYPGFINTEIKDFCKQYSYSKRNDYDNSKSLTYEELINLYANIFNETEQKILKEMNTEKEEKVE